MLEFITFTSNKRNFGACPGEMFSKLVGVMTNPSMTECVVESYFQAALRFHGVCLETQYEQ